MGQPGSAGCMQHGEHGRTAAGNAGEREVGLRKCAFSVSIMVPEVGMQCIWLISRLQRLEFFNSAVPDLPGFLPPLPPATLAALKGTVAESNPLLPPPPLHSPQGGPNGGPGAGGGRPGGACAGPAALAATRCLLPLPAVGSSRSPPLPAAGPAAGMASTTAPAAHGRPIW